MKVPDNLHRKLVHIHDFYIMIFSIILSQKKIREILILERVSRKKLNRGLKPIHARPITEKHIVIPTIREKNKAANVAMALMSTPISGIHFRYKMMGVKTK